MVFKSVEELQYEINELKRRLSFVLNENQMLRVKYRKLETATLNKDKKIEYLMNPRKNYEMRKIVAENGSSIIFNLQKRNKELEEILAQKDALNRKYHNEIRTARLYSRRIQVEGCRKGGRASLQASQTPLVSRITGNDENPPRTSLQDHSSWESTNRKNDAGKCIESKVASNPYIRSIFTSHNSEVESRENEDPEKLAAIIWSLKEIVQSFRQRELDAGKAMHLKNLELENLTVELRRIRSRLNSQNRKPMSYDRRSSSTGSLPQDSKRSSSSFLASKSHKSKGPCRQPSVPHNAVPCNRDIRFGWQKCLETFEAREISLEAVVEQSEDIVADIPPGKELQYHVGESDSLVQDLSSSIEASAMKIDPQSKPGYSKMKIEYSIDSEVSSDGEEVYIIRK